MPKRSTLVAAPLCLAALAAVSPAQAQDDIDAERFKPAITHDGFVQVEGSAVRPEDDRWEFGLFVGYAHNPLVIVNGDNEVQYTYVGNRLGAEVFASMTVVGPFAIGLGLPFFPFQAGDADPDVAGLGDLRIVPKIRILDERDLFGLAIAAELRPPTHLGDFSGGADPVLFWPKLILDNRFTNGIRLGMNAGVSIRGSDDFFNVAAGSEFTFGGAFGYRFGGMNKYEGPNGDGAIELGLELDAAVGFREQDAEELPIETLLYMKINPTPEWEILFGPGFGLPPGGYGTPLFRVFAGVKWTPTGDDKDNDGVGDEEDKCPDQAEDHDGDRDSDGCPEEEADDDQDGVPNSEDDCPEAKETINGVQDEDGCPDTGDPRVVYEEGEVKVLDTVKFKTGSAELEPESHSLLDQVALTIKANPEIEKVRVEGHTDETGADDTNQKLSEARAESVKKYLINKGIAKDRLDAKGYGESKPLSDKTDPASLAKNRRVEFKVEK